MAIKQTMKEEKQKDKQYKVDNIREQIVFTCLLMANEIGSKNPNSGLTEGFIEDARVAHNSGDMDFVIKVMGNKLLEGKYYNEKQT